MKSNIDRIMLNYFNNDQEKLDKWYEKKNFFFSDGYGNPATPSQMIKLGKEEELLQFIQRMLFND